MYEKLKEVTCKNCGNIINVEYLIEIAIKVKELNDKRNKWNEYYEGTQKEFLDIQLVFERNEKLKSDVQQELQELLLKLQKPKSEEYYNDLIARMRNLKSEIYSLQEEIKEKSICDLENDEFSKLGNELIEKQQLMTEFLNNYSENEEETRLNKKIKSLEKKSEQLANIAGHLKIKMGNFKANIKDIDDEIQELLTKIGE